MLDFAIAEACLFPIFLFDAAKLVDQLGSRC
jgi:hypothetical protein